MEEVRRAKYSWLETLITKNGGFPSTAKELKLETKKKIIKMSEGEVKNKILDLTNKLNIDRMPVSSEILSEYGDRMHNNIVRKGGYRYFADQLGLSLKHSETKLGQDYELILMEILQKEGFVVKKMTTGHPFDLLVNGTVKVDVKVSNASYDKQNNRLHTFGINKRHASCDIYIAVTLDEKKEIERVLIIPSHHLKVVTLCIGKNSKYNKYNWRFDYIRDYSGFFKSIK